MNYSGPEFACIQGWGIFDGPSDDAMINALAAWHVNVVHMGLNEDCVLGINGVPAQYGGANYMNAIKAFVNRLHAHGLYAEISLMWAAPGNQRALDHPPILDMDHSPAAWTAIANAFKDDSNTFFGLQSEPHDISWACWKNGGSSCNVGYAAFGMQSALNTIRATTATNVITASGIDWANNLQQWLANRPTDPLNQLMAEQHVYGGNTCYTRVLPEHVHRPGRRAGPGRLRRVRRDVRRLELRDHEHPGDGQLGRRPRRQLRSLDMGHVGRLPRADLGLRRHAQRQLRQLDPQPLPAVLAAVARK